VNFLEVKKIEYPYFFGAQKSGGEFGCRIRFGARVAATAAASTQRDRQTDAACHRFKA